MLQEIIKIRGYFLVSTTERYCQIVREPSAYWVVHIEHMTHLNPVRRSEGYIRRAVRVERILFYFDHAIVLELSLERRGARSATQPDYERNIRAEIGRFNEPEKEIARWLEGALVDWKEARVHFILRKRLSKRKRCDFKV